MLPIPKCFQAKACFVRKLTSGFPELESAQSNAIADLPGRFERHKGNAGGFVGQGSSEHRIVEGIVSQIGDDLGLFGPGGIPPVALPLAQRDGRNTQLPCGFGLHEAKFETPAAEMSTQIGGILWDWNSSVGGW